MAKRLSKRRHKHKFLLLCATHEECFLDRFEINRHEGRVQKGIGHRIKHRKEYTHLLNRGINYIIIPAKVGDDIIPHVKPKRDTEDDCHHNGCFGELVLGFGDGIGRRGRTEVGLGMLPELENDQSVKNHEESARNGVTMEKDECAVEGVKLH